MKIFIGWKPLTVVLVAVFTLAGCMHTPAQEAPRQDDTDMSAGATGSAEGEINIDLNGVDTETDTEAEGTVEGEIDAGSTIDY